MKHKKKKVNHAKKSVASNKRQAINPLMLQQMAQMQQQPNEEQGEQGMDSEGMEGGMGGMQQAPRSNYKGRNF